MYVLNRDSMGEFNSAQNNVYQQLALGQSNFFNASYFNGTVYLCLSELRAFTISNALLPTTPTTQSSAFGSATVSISSNGATNGIVWAVLGGAGGLWAFNAANVTSAIYNSGQAGSRDSYSNIPGRFITPTVVDGKVYFGTGSSVVVFGLLP